jgi:ABC-type nitrate/sulfonate/bicarbonate transport system substrate-binding protein
MVGGRTGKARLGARTRRVGLLLLLVGARACTPTAPAPAAPASEGAAAAAGAAPPLAAAAPANAANAPAAPTFPRPEREQLEVAEAASSITSVPLRIAIDAGYLAEQGLTINLSQMAASVAVQGLVSGTVDIYQGGTAPVSARLGGADLIYVASSVDRSSLTLFGERGLTSFPEFRGKSVATTSVGAFGEIALFHTAKQYGMVPTQDFDIRYHPNPAAAATTFRSGAAQGAILTPPQSTELAHDGYPVVMDYYQQGLKIIGPATAVLRSYARDNPNTLRAYFRAILTGMRRAIDDREFAIAVHSKYAQVDDPRVLAEDYELGFRLWNRDMTVDPAAIAIVLDNSPVPGAREANVADFYDNTLISEVNATYGVKLFPDEIKVGRQ